MPLFILNVAFGYKGVKVKSNKSSWSERHVLGAAQPVLVGAAATLNEGGIGFTMGCNGIDVPFIVDHQVLADLDGNPDGALDVLAIFAKYRARIIGVASRLLRAGVTGSPVVLHLAYFR